MTVALDQPGQAATPPSARPATDQSKAASKVGLRLLLVLVALLLSVVVVAPIALSSGELVRWASSQFGLGLAGAWPWLVFVALDCAAVACVLLAIYRAFLGMGAGVFGLLVWVFAGFSAMANYRHGTEPGAALDSWWFFPVMSVMGPALLEAVTHFIRHMIQKNSGKRAGERPKFGLTRWLPIVGAPRDTYGARRTAQILGISTVNEAVATYHELCPDGSLRVVRAIRARDVAAADERGRLEKVLADEAAKAARAAVRSGALTVDQLADHQSTAGPTRLRPAAATSRPSATTVRAAVGTGHSTSQPTGPNVHSTTAIADAAQLRTTYPTGLPEQGPQRRVREALGWSSEKATRAIRAYTDGADLTPSVPAAGAVESSGAAAPGSASAPSAAPH